MRCIHLRQMGWVVLIAVLAGAAALPATALARERGSRNDREQSQRARKAEARQEERRAAAEQRQAKLARLQTQRAERQAALRTQRTERLATQRATVSQRRGEQQARLARNRAALAARQAAQRATPPPRRPARINQATRQIDRAAGRIERQAQGVVRNPRRAEQPAQRIDDTTSSVQRQAQRIQRRAQQAVQQARRRGGDPQHVQFYSTRIQRNANRVQNEAAKIQHHTEQLKLRSGGDQHDQRLAKLHATRIRQLSKRMDYWNCHIENLTDHMKRPPPARHPRVSHQPLRLKQVRRVQRPDRRHDRPDARQQDRHRRRPRFGLSFHWGGWLTGRRHPVVHHPVVISPPTTVVETREIIVPAAPVEVVVPVAPVEPAVDGWDLLATGRAREALAFFADAYRRNPEWGLARIGYALARAQLDHHDDAVQAMRQALRVDPAALDVVYVEPRLWNILQDLLARYHERTRLGHPAHRADAWFMLAAIDYMQGDYDRARLALRNAQELGDNDPAADTLRQMIDARAAARHRYDPLVPLDDDL